MGLWKPRFKSLLHHRLPMWSWPSLRASVPHLQNWHNSTSLRHRGAVRINTVRCSDTGYLRQILKQEWGFCGCKRKRLGQSCSCYQRAGQPDIRPHFRNSANQQLADEVQYGPASVKWNLFHKRKCDGCPFFLFPNVYNFPAHTNLHIFTLQKRPAALGLAKGALLSRGVRTWKLRLIRPVS